MEMNRKLFGILVLAIFLVSAVPLAMARYGDGQDDINDDREDSRISDDEGRLELENESDDDNSSDDSNDDSLDDVGGHRFANVTECVADYKERMPNVNETKIKAACEYAFKVREVLGPKFGDNLPRVQRFIVQNQDKIEDWLEKLDDKSADMIQKLDRARLEKCLNNTDDCKEKIKDWKVKEMKVKDLLKKRFVDEKKFIKARDNFLKAQNKYLEAKKNQLKVRDEFLQLKLRLAECKTNNQNCSALENQTFEKAQEDLNQIADKLISYLDKVKSKVEGSENLNETEVNDTIKNIDALITKLEDAKDAVDAADTKAELQAAGKLILNAWKEMDFKALFYAERLVHSRVGEIFTRSELLEKKLDVVVAKLENKSINVTGLQDLLDDFSAKIDDARIKMTKANKLFAEAKDLRANNKTAEAKEKLEEAKKLTKQAHQDLKEAHKILMDLVHKINQKGESFNPDKIDENEEVELVGEDD